MTYLLVMQQFPHLDSLLLAAIIVIANLFLPILTLLGYLFNQHLNGPPEVAPAAALSKLNSKLARAGAGKNTTKLRAWIKSR